MGKQLKYSNTIKSNEAIYMNSLLETFDGIGSLVVIEIFIGASNVAE